MEKKDVLRKKHDQKYRFQHREEINQRKRETWQHQQNKHIATASNVYNIDKVQQITEAIPDHQLSANCSKPNNSIQQITEVILDDQSSENYSNLDIILDY